MAKKTFIPDQVAELLEVVGDVFLRCEDEVDSLCQEGLAAFGVATGILVFHLGVEGVHPWIV